MNADQIRKAEASGKRVGRCPECRELTPVSRSGKPYPGHRTACQKRTAKVRNGLVELAQKTASTIAKPPYRAVVIVTDEAGDFVGVGMNTTLDDAIAIMKCALYADGLQFHDVDQEQHSKRARLRSPRPTSATEREKP